MSEGRNARRRLSAALAAAALLLAGAPLHQHLGAAGDSAPALSADAPHTGGAHASADCPACQTHGRVRAVFTTATLAATPPALVAFRFFAGGAPADPSAASRPPTPPRGPPSPTA